MAKKKLTNRLEPLKWYPNKIYEFNSTIGEWNLIQDENQEKEENYYIKNYNGGVSVGKIHGRVKPLRKGCYILLNDDIGGDAPKDFIKIYEFGIAKKIQTNNWSKQIAKIGHKWYPLESISEHLLNRIGEVIGLKMAKSQLRVAHGQLRFLSEYFLEKDEIMVHGAQIYSAYLLENDTKFVQQIEERNWSRELLTFQFTDDAIKFMFPQQYEEIMNQLVELLIFDAITGNNDRHFYNWAVITHVRGKYAPKFSPIYDSARGLFWNRSEEIINRKFYEGKGEQSKINQNKLNTYLNNSRPKIGWDGWNGDREINHFELISKINKHYPQHRNTCNCLLKSVHLQSIIDLLDNEFIIFYTPKRLHLIKECLKKRFENITNLCKSNSYA